MKRYCKHIILVVVAVVFVFSCFAQGPDQNINVRFTIPEIAMIDIEPGLSYVVFEIEASSVPGGEPVVKKLTTDNTWINYSSAIRQHGNKRSINVQISEGSVPDGTAFYIEASPSSAFGSANQGISAGKVNVQRNPRPIITNIGNCFTGDGVNNGHELKYFLEISDFNKLQSAVNDVFTVMYTITEN